MIEYREGPLAEGQTGRFVAGERLRPEIAGDGTGWRLITPSNGEDVRAWCARWGVDHRLESSIDATLLVRPDGYLGCVRPMFDADALDRYLREKVGRVR
jgi:hypothetical protein